MGLVSGTNCIQARRLAPGKIRGMVQARVPTMTDGTAVVTKLAKRRRRTAALTGVEVTKSSRDLMRLTDPESLSNHTVDVY